MQLYKIRSLGLLITGLILLFPAIQTLQAQTRPLLLSDAINTGLNNYQSIQAKRNYYNASAALVQNTRNEYLPNVVGSLQQDFGTINGQFGPLTAYGAPGVSSSGPPNNSQSWHAAFGSSYLINTNFEVFTFGRVISKIKWYRAQANSDSADLTQEQFVQSVRTTSAYLNLLIAQRLISTAQSNVDRVMFVQGAVVARTRSGLNAGVDSSIVNAEVSGARLALINANNNELEVRNQLAQWINVPPTEFVLDTTYFHTIPNELNTTFDVSENPQAKYYQSRIDVSNEAAIYIKKSIMPGVNLFGIFQTRGSGFGNDYMPGINDYYSENYFKGIAPKRMNYVTGVSLAWNFLSPKKISEQVRSQQFLTRAYENEYNLISTQLKAQLILADQQLQNSLESIKEVPVQYKAAADAYLQKSVLYKNGLTTIIDLQQGLYLINRAETDLAVAYINVWQALLQKAAASGDFNLLLRQVK